MPLAGVSNRPGRRGRATIREPGDLPTTVVPRRAGCTGMQREPCGSSPAGPPAMNGVSFTAGGSRMKYLIFLASSLSLATPVLARNTEPHVPERSAPAGVRLPRRPTITVVATGLSLPVDQRPVDQRDRPRRDRLRSRDPTSPACSSAFPASPSPATAASAASPALRVRGAEAEQLLVLVDGVRVNDVAAPGGGLRLRQSAVGRDRQGRAAARLEQRRLGQPGDRRRARGDHARGRRRRGLGRIWRARQLRRPGDAGSLDRSLRHRPDFGLYPHATAFPPPRPAPSPTASASGAPAGEAGWR